MKVFFFDIIRPRVVPLLPEVAPAADVRDGVDDAPVEEARERRVERDERRRAVGAVARQEERGRAVPRDVLAEDDATGTFVPSAAVAKSRSER